MTHPAESWSTLLAAGKVKDTAGFLLTATNRMVIALVRCRAVLGGELLAFRRWTGGIPGPG